jgi:hypothetical protein
MQRLILRVVVWTFELAVEVMDNSLYTSFIPIALFTCEVIAIAQFGCMQPCRLLSVLATVSVRAIVATPLSTSCFELK